jgi:hypothetical protein
VDNYITLSELLLLLAVSWLPIFVVAATIQWRLLNLQNHRFIWLGMALVLEVVLAFAVWVSPLHRLFFDFAQFTTFSIFSIPFQAAVVAATITTILVFLLRRGAPPNPAVKRDAPPAARPLL